MQIVWEATLITPSLVTVITICVLILCLCVFLFMKPRILVRCLCVVVILMTLSFLVFSIFLSYDEWTYAQNNQKIVEGEIHGFSGGANGSDSFYVGDVYFYCSPAECNIYAYTIPKRDPNSVIDGNGQYVRITYCEKNGVNSITRIETKTDT